MYDERFRRLIKDNSLEHHLALQRQFPQLHYANTVVQQPNSRILIDDVSYRALDREPEVEWLDAYFATFALEGSSKGRIKIFSFPDLMEQMNIILQSISDRYSANDTLLVFPGNGSQQIKQWLAQDLFRRFPQHADLPLSGQKVPGVKSRIFTVEQIQVAQELLRSEFGLEGPRTGIIFDDFTNTGSTNGAIIEASGWENTQWVSVNAIMTSPLFFPQPAESPSGIPGVETTVAPLIVNGECNLLSTVLKNGPRMGTYLRDLVHNYVDPHSRDTFAEHYIRLWYEINYPDQQAA